MLTFRAKLGTTFRYRADLSGEVLVQVRGEEAAAGANTVACGDHVVSTIGVPLEDVMEFAAHLSGVPETPEGQNVIATAYVMNQLRELGVFRRATGGEENAARELFLSIFAGQRPGAALGEYDLKTKELASAHVASCVACSETTRCADYWRIMLDRTQAKKPGEIQ